MTPQEILLNHVCPGLGVLIAIITFGSPLPAIIKADKTKMLKEMNPLPFVAMAANCTLGSFYGQITKDWYLYVANTVGVMLSWYYILTSYKYLGAKEQNRVLKVTLAAISVFVVVGAVNLPRIVDMQKLWGCTAVAILAIYYVAPLSSLVTVLRERDSSTLYWPLCLTNLTNGLLWFVYGMARKDYFFIAMPNAMGVVTNAFSLLLCLILPARVRQHDSEDSLKCSSSTGGRSMLRRLMSSISCKSSSDQCLPRVEPADTPVDADVSVASKDVSKPL